jgi:histidyl-tRNA synthetase
LFVRGLGEVTDIVEKEMYSFVDSMNGDRLSLRPESTAGVVRAMTEHSVLRDGGRRLYYIGPMFRHERPQKGRSRQFHQFGAEALGYAGPDVDAELILMLRALWRVLGLNEGEDLRLELNSLGQPAERQAHRAALIAHFEAHAGQLDEDAGRRLHSNPLRILDSKNPAMQALIEAAPQLPDFLGAESLAHFDAVRAVLDAAGLAYRLNPRLVRGMDYYNLTVFEWVTDKLGAQGTVCGGGRYDGLIEQLGGKPAPGVGFGLGMERLLLLLEELGLTPPPVAPLVYAVVPGPAVLPQALVTLEALRAAGVTVLMNAGFSGMKSQFKRADASGARHALIFGDDEVARGEVALKNLRDATAPQRSLALAAVADWAAELLTA